MHAVGESVLYLFLIKDIDTIPIGKCEQTEEGREKLVKF